MVPGIDEVSCVDDTKVVDSPWPLKFTTDTGVKSPPDTRIVVSDAPEETEDGVSLDSRGDG
jgi:hypothetical protein